ncbi:hypothetical protein [Colwellia asteriadis]
MKKIEPLTEFSFEQNNGQLFTNPEYLSMGSMNMEYISKTSWAIPLTIAFCIGIALLISYPQTQKSFALYWGGRDKFIYWLMASLPNKSQIHRKHVCLYSF